MRTVLQRAARTSLALAILFSLAAVFAPHVNATPPKAKSQQECVLVADMVLVAHAMEKRSVRHATADRVLADVYENLTGGEDAKRWAALLDAAARFARSKAVEGEKSFELSAGVVQLCHAKRGDLSAIFGTGT